MKPAQSLTNVASSTWNSPEPIGTGKSMSMTNFMGSKEWGALLNRVAVLERQMERLGAPQYRLVKKGKR